MKYASGYEVQIKKVNCKGTLRLEAPELKSFTWASNQEGWSSEGLASVEVQYAEVTSQSCPLKSRRQLLTSGHIAGIRAPALSVCARAAGSSVERRALAASGPAATQAVTGEWLS